MAGFHSASDYSKLTFLLQILAGIFLVLSFGAPFWTTRYNGYAGPWRGCQEGVCYDRYNQWNEPWVRAVQAFMTMSLFTYAGGMLCITCYIFALFFHEDKRMVLLTAICAIATSLFSLIAVLIWSFSQYTGNSEVLNWAYALCWFCSIASGVAGALMVIELRTPLETGKLTDS